MKPEYIYRAKYTLPNLPSPNFFINLKFYLETPMPSLLDFCFRVVFLPWFLKNDGKVFSDLCSVKASFEFDVDEVSFSAFTLPPEFLAIKNLPLISGVLGPLLPGLLL